MDKVIAIAIDEYIDPTISNLKNCSRDINHLINILSEKYQFDSIELFAKKEQTTLSFLYNELYNELINSLDADSVLILFAGHGEFNPILEASYWLCSDSQKSNVTTWFNVSDLLKFFNASPALHIALISDSCFSGAIFDLNRGGGLTALDSKKSRQALTSGGVEKVSDGDENGGSPFNKVLINILSKNTLKAFSFNQLSETTITNFNQKRNQTPSFGSLANSGDKGGVFFFKLKEEKDLSVAKSVQISLDISDKVKIDSSFEIPFFNDNKYFKNDLINAFVQQLGYSIVNDVRIFVATDEEYSISRSSEMEFYLEVTYTVETLNDKFLSILISRNDYFGGAHPNHYVYSINFAFNPERRISLYDILDYNSFSSLENFLDLMINKYGEAECKEMLKQYSTYEYAYDLDFSFTDRLFTIFYTNLFPHALKGCGLLEIPINEVKFKI